MSLKQLIEYIADAFTLEEVLNILGKDPDWLLWKIKDELLKHKDEFFNGDESYAEIDWNRPGF